MMQCFLCNQFDQAALLHVNKSVQLSGILTLTLFSVYMHDLLAQLKGSNTSFLVGICVISQVIYADDPKCWATVVSEGVLMIK